MLQHLFVYEVSGSVNSACKCSSLYFNVKYYQWTQFPTQQRTEVKATVSRLVAYNLFTLWMVFKDNFLREKLLTYFAGILLSLKRLDNDF